METSGRRMSTKVEHRYMPPDKVQELRCECCVHFFDNRNRCGLIRDEDGPVNPGDCCANWNNPGIMADVYGVVEKPLTKAMEPPDLGRLMTKAEARFAEEVDDSIEGCSDCVFFAAPGTCTLMRDEYVEAEGACARYWRNPLKEAKDERLYAEFKTPPPEVGQGFAAQFKGWVKRMIEQGLLGGAGQGPRES